MKLPLPPGYRRTLLSALFCSVAALFTPSGYAQQTLRLIVPFAPGGAIDTTARALAEAARDALGTIIIENRAGAGGNIGVDAVAKAKPDGLTIGIATVANHAVNPWLYAQLPYDAARDFAGITQMVRVPNVLVMNAERADALKIHSMADLIAYAKANPGKLNYGSGGNGSAGHLAGELLKQRADISVLHVPYRGGNPAQLALLSGEVDFNIDNLVTAAANIRAGKLRALAVTSATPSPLLPKVPALVQTFPDFVIDTWWGLIAPAGTPEAVVQRLNRAFVDALNAPATKTRFAALMAEPMPSSPAQFDRFMADERAKYQAIVAASGAQVD